MSRLALVEFTLANALLAMGHLWRALVYLDLALGLLWLVGLVASRIWRNRIWIRGTR